MAGKELELQLMDGGNKLLNPPFSIDELLSILERVEVSLSKVDQSPRQSMVAALSPLRNALVSDKLLRHSDTDVKVSVAVCISEIIRITAPDAPYDDEKMKEIFHLIVAVFHKLSHTSSCCYSKVVLVLVTMAKTRAILVMMDLECHALIIEMFQLFLRITRSNNSEVVLDAMVTTMTIAILESDDISLEILVPLLASVRKENQNVFPKSWKLGKEVIKNCAARIEPYILKAVSSLGVPVDSYDQIVGSICQNATDCIKSFDVPGSEEHLINDERPAIQCMGGKRLRCKTTSENPGTEETTDKGQSVDFLSAGSSLKLYIQQQDQSVNPWSCQKEKQQNQGMQIPSSEDTFPANNGGSNVCSGTTIVQGYEVKASVAPVLTAIFAKYGDIAANCQYKSPSVRACLLEIVSDVVRRLQSTDIPLTVSEIKVLQNEMKDLEATKLKLSWLTQPLEKISEVERIAGMRSMLKSVKASSMLVIKAATKELEDALMELVALQKRMGEAEKRINAMKLVVQKVDNAIKEAEDQERHWLRNMNELP
ncbi:hypothetical protein P3X46_010778 [Hevea brasiliensis]|uniref:TATA-binding protein interacting (TIP20) domain-containing protein n=1 Tax=Hevea brasiliensis TaxID=3981 RepID=A0ABQ9MF45_HEVBR|nr:sister chromatid cohesion protein PDS5 homolog C [Hevea brasiliensis]KAJ9178934.1 hypothetical protein P3X46_010778 [Hevea brasiliensis]